MIHGEVINTRDVITFQGQSVAAVRKAFRESVDDYLAFCKSRGESPDKPFSGRFVARIPPDLHRAVSFAASLAGKSLNAWVANQLENAVLRSTGLESGMSRPRTARSKKAPVADRVEASRAKPGHVRKRERKSQPS